MRVIGYTKVIPPGNKGKLPKPGRPIKPNHKFHKIGEAHRVQELNNKIIYHENIDLIVHNFMSIMELLNI